MFKKKYVFETRATRIKRIYKKFLFGVALFCTLFIALLLYLPYFSKTQKEMAMEAFFKKDPDIIAVFTGDGGRISYGLELLEKHPSAKLFITGVYSKNSLKTILKKQTVDISIDEFLKKESHHIDLEFIARNTVENSLATLHYISKQQNIKDILIITSDYHVLRSYLIMNTLKRQNSHFNFYFESLENNFFEWRNIKILLREAFKIIKTSTFLLFWEQESLES